MITDGAFLLSPRPSPAPRGLWHGPAHSCSASVSELCRLDTEPAVPGARPAPPRPVLPCVSGPWSHAPPQAARTTEPVPPGLEAGARSPYSLRGAGREPSPPPAPRSRPPRLPGCAAERGLAPCMVRVCGPCPGVWLRGPSTSRAAWVRGRVWPSAAVLPACSESTSPILSYETPALGFGAHPDLEWPHLNLSTSAQTLFTNEAVL